MLEENLSESEYENEARLLGKLEIQEEAEDEQKFILTEEEFPLKGYKNWQPLRNANLVDYNDDNSRKNYQCSNKHVKWLEDNSKPKNDELPRIKDKSSKNKKKSKEEKEYFWITQNKKIFPSLQAHLARQYQILAQNGDWKEEKNKNGNTNHEYLSNEEEFQGQYLNEERRNELTAKKAKFKRSLDNNFSHCQ
ncbi:hypothetical protein O181_133899 [Austropuccinia psidii MF-1]|uniref:Uncharacterized protein n=1 Tax=Austropuccinia psidii MF-1 TaxID=1389203 RepID=A0A9Q3QDA5_9BASI|nr:hypothetical protein [Austropuccinia psidii MF-1]